MTEVYAVETVLNLKTDVLTKLTKMIARFEELGASIKQVQLQFDKLTGNVDGAVAASERLKTVTAEISAEAGIAAKNYAKIAEAQGLAAREGRAGPHGGGMFAGGVAALGLFGGFHAIKTEAENQKELMKLSMDQRVTDDQAKAMRAKAEEMTHSAPGTTIAGNLGILLDAFTILRNVEQSMAIGPTLAGVQAWRTMMGGKETGSYDAIKFAETLQKTINPEGKIDSTKLAETIKSEQAVEAAFQGRVNPQMLLAFAKQARLSGMIISDDFLFKDLPAVIQAIGGQRAGTGLQAEMREFLSGTMTKEKFGQLQELGIINKSLAWNKGAAKPHIIDNLTGTMGEDLTNSAEAFAMDLIANAIKNHVNPNDPKAMAKYLDKVGATNTGKGFIGELILGRENIAKDHAAIDNVVADPLAAARQHDPMGAALGDFNSSLNRFLSTLGSDLLPGAAKALDGLSTALDGMDKALKSPVGHDLELLAAGIVALASVKFAGGTIAFVGRLAKIGEAVAPFAEGGRAAAGLMGAANGLKAVAGVEGLATVGTALGSLATGIGLVAGAIGGWYAVLHDVFPLLFGDHATPVRPGEVPPSLSRPGNESGEGPHHGEHPTYSPHGGGPIHRESYLVPPSSKAPTYVQVTSYTTLDGRVLSKTVSDHLARAGELPQGGTSRVDLGYSSPSSGQAFTV